MRRKVMTKHYCAAGDQSKPVDMKTVQKKVQCVLWLAKSNSRSKCNVNIVACTKKQLHIGITLIGRLRS